MEAMDGDGGVGMGIERLREQRRMVSNRLGAATGLLRDVQAHRKRRALCLSLYRVEGTGKDSPTVKPNVAASE